MTWCRKCGAGHPDEEPCPGPLLATGPERHGWRITVDTPTGMRSYGVVVAPCGQSWRARAVTFPDQLWLVPKGRVSLKFYGSSPQDAEAQAVLFIEQYCEAQGFPAHEILPPVETQPLPAENAESFSVDANPWRRLQAAPVRFGHAAPHRKGRTLNLSERGMFICTDDPPEPGSTVRLELNLGDKLLALRGVVAWRRRRPVRGRPLGMGVRLAGPPRAYTRQLEQID